MMTRRARINAIGEPAPLVAADDILSKKLSSAVGFTFSIVVRILSKVTYYAG